MPTLKNEEQNFTAAESKNLLFSTALATALGAALEAKPQASFELTPEETPTIAPRDQIKVDTELAQAQLTYFKTQKKTQQTQRRFEQRRHAEQQQAQLRRCVRQLLRTQMLALPPLRKRLLQQLKTAKQQQQSQLQGLQQTYNAQAQVAQQQEQQVQSYTAQLHSSQNNITPGNAQNESARAYYSQQLQIAKQQFQQQQQVLLDLKNQIQSLNQTQQSQAYEQRLQAQETKQRFYQAKLADLTLAANEAQKQLDQQQTAVQQALMQEENAFDQLTAIRQKHSLLTSAQKQLIATLPTAQAPDDLLTVTCYQDGQKHTLAPMQTATGTQLQFALPTAIAGYALDLDRSVLLTDQEVVGSLWDLMDELAMTQPAAAIQCLNQALPITTGRSQRGVWVYVYQRQITLVTKYQTTKNQAAYQLSATKVLENKTEPQFEPPKAQPGYVVDWANSSLTLDDYDKNYLSSYLVAANGQGPKALTILNEDITYNRLIASKLTLTYHYRIETPSTPVEPAPKVDGKIQAFGPSRPIPAPMGATTEAVPPGPEATKPQGKPLFKSQAQLTENKPRPARQLFGKPVVTGGRLLGTYGIRKVSQQGHLVNRVMARKY